MSTQKAVLGLLTGVAIGAAVGVLLAPDKGSNTRKKLSERGNAYLSDMECKFNELVDKVSSKFESMKHDASKMIENGENEAQAKLTKASQVFK